MTDGHLSVWRRPNEAYNQHMIYATEPFGGGSVMAWGYISYDCELDLITIPMTLNAQQYQQEVLDAAVFPHFDNHPLETRPIFMDDNARPTEAELESPTCETRLSRRYHGQQGILASTQLSIFEIGIISVVKSKLGIFQ